MGSEKDRTLDDRVFQEEPIRPRVSISVQGLPERVQDLIEAWMPQQVMREQRRPQQETPPEKLPSLLRAARSLESGGSWLYQNRHSVFMKQAKLLANYEDDYPIQAKVNRYHPTYECLTDQELRSYFSWRTQVRRGNIQAACTSFAFLYFYELLNQIGVEDARQGLEKLDAFAAEYEKLDSAIRPYWADWRLSYILYYDLPATLLEDNAEVKSMHILDSAPEQPDDAILDAVKALAPAWLNRSRFYRDHPQDVNRVCAAVLRRMCMHYRARGKRTLCDQLFGTVRARSFTLFASAIFCTPLGRRNNVLLVSDDYYFYVDGDNGTEVRRFVQPSGRRSLDELIKTIDCLLRETLEPEKPPLHRPEQTKWVMKVINEEIQALLDEKKKAKQAAQRVAINFGALESIRRDAAVTQEKLRIEDELEDETPPAPPAPAQPEQAEQPELTGVLDAAEYRLLQCLLYGRPTGWVQQEGKILSVLLDSINEKLYDIFQDSVAGDDGLVEDYIDELKEMVAP